jgi:hypothetical protein
MANEARVIKNKAQTSAATPHLRCVNGAEPRGLGMNDMGFYRPIDHILEDILRGCGPVATAPLVTYHLLAKERANGFVETDTHEYEQPQVLVSSKALRMGLGPALGVAGMGILFCVVHWALPWAPLAAAWRQAAALGLHRRHGNPAGCDLLLEG